MSTEPEVTESNAPEAAQAANEAAAQAINEAANAEAIDQETSADVDADAAEATPEPDPLADALSAQAAAEARHLHLAAEFENYKKRTRRENDEFKKYANESILKEVLGVLDNFDRAIEHITNADEGIEQLKEGVVLIHKQFNDVMEKFGVTYIPAKGELFDPNVHQAVSQVESDDVPDGHVAEEFRKGFYYKERVLRPAMVVVAKAKAS